MNAIEKMKAKLDLITEPIEQQKDARAAQYVTIRTSNDPFAKMKKQVNSTLGLPEDDSRLSGVQKARLAITKLNQKVSDTIHNTEIDNAKEQMSESRKKYLALTGTAEAELLQEERIKQRHDQYLQKFDEIVAKRKAFEAECEIEGGKASIDNDSGYCSCVAPTGERSGIHELAREIKSDILPLPKDNGVTEGCNCGKETDNCTCDQ